MKDSFPNAFKLLWWGISAQFRNDYQAAFTYSNAAREMFERLMKK